MSLPHRRRQWYCNTRHRALLEYASLKHYCPEGIYISLRPGRPAEWAGLLFVRKGPYAPAILRFNLSFPTNYPALPPSITFVSDIFHPLVSPLTTYTYSTGSLNSETVSATDDERLPPGGFSLRHGFPHWFGRAEKSVPPSKVTSRNVSGSLDGHEQLDQDARKRPISAMPSPKLSSQGPSSPFTSSSSSSPQHTQSSSFKVGIQDVLDYMKSAFDDTTTMDALPLEAAGNPGAWNAWRAHRKTVFKASSLGKPDAANNDPGQAGANDIPEKPALTKTKLPSEWNWDGVWQERVQKGIDASISSSALYGGFTSGMDDLIQFVDVDDDLIQAIKERTLK